MIIITDTREKHPYQFKAFKTITRKLKTGDYSIEGLEEIICIERKTLMDFLNSITQGRKRFFKELSRMQFYYTYNFLILEFNLSDIYNQKYDKLITPEAVIGTINSIIVDYGINVIFCCNRQIGLKTTEKLLARLYRKEKHWI